MLIRKDYRWREKDRAKKEWENGSEWQKESVNGGGW
jgi:hypothetical protein